MRTFWKNNSRMVNNAFGFNCTVTCVLYYGVLVKMLPGSASALNGRNVSVFAIRRRKVGDSTATLDGTLPLIYYYNITTYCADDGQWTDVQRSMVDVTRLVLFRCKNII